MYDVLLSPESNGTVPPIGQESACPTAASASIPCVPDTDAEIARFLPERCELCPRRCDANRRAGQRGLCGADSRLIVARAALHFWEEPPLSGESGSGAVFFSHCALGCVYCQNAPISAGAVGKPIGLQRLVEIYFELFRQGALNINLVTPTHYAPLVIESLRRAQSKGLNLPIVWNTSGYETVEAIAQLNGIVDVYLTDFKYAGAAVAQRYSNAPDYPDAARAALDAMVLQDNAQVIVRHLLLPGKVEDSKAVVRMLWERYGSRVTLSLMSQYTPCSSDNRFPELSSSVTPEEYEELLDYADSLGMEDYFWQSGDAARESFIPAWDYSGV